MKINKANTTKRIVNGLKVRRDKMISTLMEMVSIETPSRDKASQKPIFDYLISKLRRLGYYCLHVNGRVTGGYLYARPVDREQNQPVQLLVGHCDTVWKKHTLEKMPIKELDGMIKGPGIYDMKAGLTQILYAIEILNELEIKPALLPVILINSDEEIGSFESTHAIRRLASISSRAFVLEPPLGLDGKLKTSRKGVGRFSIIVKGKAAHAGLDPGKGVNAIVELSHLVQRLHAMNDFERGITVNIGMIEGGSSANVVAPESKAVIDVRVSNHKDGEEITNRIRNLKPTLDDVELIIDGGIGRPPMEPTERNQQLWRIARSNGRLIGLELEQARAGGGSDGNTTSLYTATLDGMGTVGDGAHAEHEFIYTNTIVERTALLSLMLLEEPNVNF